MRQSIVAASLRVGVETLRANPLRTVLSTLGVIMGVASLVAVLAIGDGVEAFARAQIEQTTDLQAILVTPLTYDLIDDVRVPRSDYPVFSPSDGDALALALGERAAVGLMVQGSARVVVPDSSRPRATTVTAATASMLRIHRTPLVAGRIFTDGESRAGARVALISPALGAIVAPGVPVSGLPGRRLVLERDTFSIIGVTPGTRELAATVPFGVAAAAMVPAPTPRAPMMIVRAARVEDVTAVKAATEQWLTTRLGSWQHRVAIGASQGLRLEQARQGIVIFKLVMGTFAGISLIVGGIGIMNVLLAAVTERTREIGIRKATGARQRDILIQFLAESVAITGAGSVIGAGLGLAGAFAAAWVMRRQTHAEVHAAFTWATLVIAALVSVLTGLGFGTYPALRASRLSPIDAIRHE